MRHPVFRLPAWLPVDGYLLALLGTVGLAALLPARGAVATGADGAATGAVALLFFLYGARLSTGEAMAGLRHWRLHLTTLACTFLVFPGFGLAARVLVPEVLPPALYTGLLFLCLVPSTVQSAIAFTSIARGNVAAAICAGSFSSIVGIVLTPLLAGLVLPGNGGGGFSAHALVSVGCQLLLPFLAGQLLRRWWSKRGRARGVPPDGVWGSVRQGGGGRREGKVLTRYKKVLGYVDRGSILLVVYAAFSAGMVQGIWHQVSPLRLLCLLGVEAVLLAAMLTVTSYGSKRLGFSRADRIAITFAGSKKSLAAGLPMASVLFGAQAGTAVLPLMLFHQMQLMVCAVLAKRYAAQADVAKPADEAQPAEAEERADAVERAGRANRANRANRRGRAGQAAPDPSGPDASGPDAPGPGLPGQRPASTRSNGSPSTSGPATEALPSRTRESSASVKARR